MTGMLDSGTRLTVETGEEVQVVDMLGAGGQGEVYRVKTSVGEKALKWYYPTCATAEQEGIVRELVSRDFDDDRFLWPEAYVPWHHGSFGYLMGLRPDRFKGLPALFRRQLRTSTRALLTACLYTVEAYQALHSRGIAYRDISWGNVFFDPDTGDILVCDNDNAVVEGDASGISGTMEFMAPELVRAEPGARPGTQSDLHSLAVLLFMFLMNHHPLKGRRELAIHCLDEAAERKLYGKNPLFVFDPADDSNEPDPMEHATVLATWDASAGALQKLFRRSFTAGLHDPAVRVRESEWRDALRAVRDAVVECASCGRQNMTEPGEHQQQASRPCWGCGALLVLPPRLTVTTPPPRTERHIRLPRAARVQAHHLQAEPARHDYSDASLVAELVEHPTKPGRFGIANRSDRTWAGTRSDGTSQQIGPGQTVPLRAGLELDLGDGSRAVVRAK
ncbi:serine/threonine protein kinase [Streptomyces sp. BH-SS-21]|uniref:Serine/threonine protein kinase n=1 Tax=Streptomyces liliiviolaceus TaxID=2823109 RepID=A0A940Y171_9ACTN|nr:serine/threonine-protein kinase [Streptomyces liliiviolaceus]MBQ0852648.1 serine/threonine protein kinase [Streptomyces liliiviolaceus]